MSSGAELVAEARQALRQAHLRVLDPTPQGIDSSRPAFATAVNSLRQLRSLLKDSPESGRELIPPITALRNELATVTSLLQRAAWHRSNLLQCMLQASAADLERNA